MTSSERSLIGQIGAHKSWAKTANRSARTAPARDGLAQRFLEQAGGDPLRAESLRKAFYAEMTYKSVQARRKAREALAEARGAEAALERLNGGDAA